MNLKNNLSKLISAAIYITIGVLCIVAGAKFASGKSGGDELETVSVIIGVVSIVVGSLTVVLAITFGILQRKSFAMVAIPGAMLLGVGASLVAYKYAGDLIVILISIVPFLLIAVGAIMLADSIHSFVRIKEKRVVGVFICTVIVSVASIVLGILCVGDDPVIGRDVQLIVFGIIVTLAGLFKLLSAFVKIPSKVVVVEKE